MRLPKIEARRPQSHTARSQPGLAISERVIARPSVMEDMG